MFAADPPAPRELVELLHEPSLYDEFLRFLARRGLRRFPTELLRPRRAEPTCVITELVAGLPGDLRAADRAWDVYEACE